MLSRLWESWFSGQLSSYLCPQKNLKKYLYFMLFFGFIFSLFKAMGGEPGPTPASGWLKKKKKPLICILEKQNLSLNRSRENGLRPKPVYDSPPADRCFLNKGNSCLCIKGLSNEHWNKWVFLSSSFRYCIKPSCQMIQGLTPKSSVPMLVQMGLPALCTHRKSSCLGPE